MSQIDILNAKRALAYLLAEWGVTDDATRKAHGFMDDLVDRGWIMAAHRETRAVPPRRSQECPHHPGSYADACGGCKADQAVGDPLPQTRRPASPPSPDYLAARQALRGALP